MGVGVWINLEQELVGSDANDWGDGKSLARAWEELNEMAARLQIKPLSEFMLLDMTGFEGLVEEEEIANLTMPLEDDTWFEPSEGLHSIRCLMDYVKMNPQTISDSEDTLEDLKLVEKTLELAETQGVRFQLGFF